MASEITEEEDTAEKEAQKRSIRRIIEYQKSLYLSSSSSSAAAMASSSSSFSHSSRRSNSLMDLMKEGSTSLRRLFAMEHTSLAAYFRDYSGSPVFKPIPLWGSDSDDEIHGGDPWSSMKQQMEMAAAQAADQDQFVEDEEVVKNQRIRRRKLSRKKAFRSLPRFGRLWKVVRGFRVFRLRLRRLRIILCGRKF